MKSLVAMLKTRLAEGEQEEFEEMLGTNPKALELFTIQQGYIKFWFGEIGLTHPRSWSREGKNVLTLSVDLVSDTIPETRNLLRLAQAQQL